MGQLPLASTQLSRDQTKLCPWMRSAFSESASTGLVLTIVGQAPRWAGRDHCLNILPVRSFVMLVTLRGGLQAYHHMLVLVSTGWEGSSSSDWPEHGLRSPIDILCGGYAQRSRSSVVGCCSTYGWQTLGSHHPRRAPVNDSALAHL